MAERAHARLPPSGSKIWMACPGQPTLAAPLVSTSSIHAERGTLAHSVLEQCLNQGHEPGVFIGNAARGTEAFVKEDADAVELALDWIRGEIEDGDETEVEQRLTYNDDLWGTCDFSRYRPTTRELLIADYKHGSGVAVDAINNPQGIIYALMKLKALGNRGVEQVRFVIIQPRGFHEAGVVREFVVPGVDMLDWEDTVVAAIASAREAAIVRATYPSEDAWVADYLHSGDHCRWCPAAAICPRLIGEAQEALDADYGALTVGYDVAKLATGLEMVPRLEALVSAIKSFSYAEAERGVRIPGFKLVAKKATARWRDEEAVAFDADMKGFLVAETHEPAKLRSPAQLRAVYEPTMPGKTKKARLAQAKEHLDTLTTYASSGHSLVAAGDARPPIKSDPAEDFAAVE